VREKRAARRGGAPGRGVVGFLFGGWDGDAALSLGAVGAFDGFLAIGLVGGDVDLSRFDFFALVEGDGENAVAQFGLDGAFVDLRGQGERALEAGPAAFDVEGAAVFLGVFLALGGDGEDAVFEGHVDVVLVEAGEFGGDVEVVGVFVNVDGVGGEFGGDFGVGPEVTQGAVEVAGHQVEGETDSSG
jgi:hypothetical protein